jgi:RHS repeat-associated protein
MPSASSRRLNLINDLSAFRGGCVARRYARRMRALLLAAAWCLCVGTLDAGAQNVQYTSKSADLGLRSDLKINPSTHGLELRIPLASYPGRAGTSLPFALNYSSKVWRMKYAGPGGNQSDVSRVTVLYGEHSQGGWTFSLGFPSFDPEVEQEKYSAQGGATGGVCQVGGNGNSCCYIDRKLVRMPDGSTHELRSTDTPVCYNTSFDPSFTPPDDMYAVDGSRLRYRKSTNELFMPDGSRYLLGSGQYVDRNGNLLTLSNGQWTDTLGRTLPGTLSVGSGTDPVLSLPGVGASTLDYTLRWRKLSEADVLSPGEQLSWTTNTTCPGVASGNHPYTLFGGGGSGSCIVSEYPVDPLVLYQVVLPTGRAYTFNYNRYGEVSKVTYPTGGYERYDYGLVDGAEWLSAPYGSANRGVVSRYVSASGSGTDEVAWQYPSGTSGGFLFGQFTQGEIAPDQTLTERLMYRSEGGAGFGYSYGGAMAGMPYEERVWSAPDPAADNGRHLLRRKLTKWVATGSNASPHPGSGGSSVTTAARNGRVEKEVEIILDTNGGPALAKVTTYEYNLTYEFTTGASLGAVNEYDYVAVDRGTAETAGVDSFAPPAQWLRRTEYDYLDDVNQSYRGRNFLGLKKETRVKDSTGVVVARTVVAYDGDGLENCPDIINHDPAYGTGFTTRGNPTSVTSYAGAAAMTGAVTTATHYDMAGNAVSATDANGNTSNFSYADKFSDDVPRNTYAYPTATTSAAPNAGAVPNPAGGPDFAAGTFGSTSGLTSYSSYDYSTGLVTSTIDANSQTTTFDYTDPLNRLKSVTRPDGGTTTYAYGRYDNAGRVSDYVGTTTALDSSRSIVSYQYFDGLGRPDRSFLYENQEAAKPWLTTDTEYDAMGRVKRASQPYRSTGSGQATFSGGRWAETSYDALSRVVAVTTRPDGAHVDTAYAGNAVTVTDQAGRRRRSVADALGRLVRVDEPDALGGNLDDAQGNPVQPTSYGYDALGNLLGVTQDVQTRTFVYDSLSRLRSAKNPESGTVSYTYDDNGNLKTKTDARGVVAAYTYDHLNRNILISYTDGTPGVKRVYDTAENGKGRYRADWTWDGVSTYYTHRAVDHYDAAGRPLDQRQYFYRNNAAGDPFATSLTYNLAGGVTSVHYPSGHAATYNYDAAGRLGDAATAGGTLPAFSGNFGGEQRTYSSEVLYDETGGVSQERFGTDTPLYHKLHYNGRGRLYDIRLSTRSLAADQWDWDRGAVVNYYSGNFAWEGNPSTPAAADNNGNLRQQQHWVPDGNGGHTYTEQIYEYDALNRLKSVAEAAGGSAVQRVQTLAQAYAYDRWGNRTINAAGTQNAPAAQYELDAGRNDNRLYAPGDTAIADLAQRRMRYDAAGNLTRDVCGNNALCARAFDAENRMVSAQTIGGQSATYTYDADGRRVKRNDGVAEVWQVYGLSGELLAEYAKDALPNQPQKEYGYRGGELLVTAEASSGWGPAPTFTGPDPLGRGDRILLEHLTDLRTAVNELRRHAGLSDYDFTMDREPVRKVTTVKAEQIRQLRRALEEALTRLGRPIGGYEHPSLTENVSPIYAADFQELRKQIRDAWRSDAGGVDIRWLVSDQLGTPRMVVNRTGSLAGVTRHDYFPFGEEVGAGVSGRTTSQGYSQPDGNRKKWATYERDEETGLDYAQARYYGSTMGRFTSVDLGPFTPADPQNWNRYAYVQNNPLKFIDPNGEKLILTGRYADYIVGELERFTGYNLTRNRKTGVVTIDTSAKREEKGTSEELAKKLNEVVGDKGVNVKINTGANQAQVFNDSFEGRKFDVADYNVAKRDAPEFAARLLGHVLEEYYQAEKQYAGLSKDEQYNKAHGDAVVFESKVLSNFTGQTEQPRTNFQVNNNTLRYVYTSVTYDVITKTGIGKDTSQSRVIRVVKSPVKKSGAP